MEKFKNFIFRKKLDVILDYIDKHRDNEEIQQKYPLYFIPRKDDDPLFGIITELFRFNKLPMIAKDTFDISSYQVLYRGAQKKTFHANLLVDTEDRFYGTGKHGSGIYATSDDKISGFYSQVQDGQPKGDVMHFYIARAQVVIESVITKIGDYLRDKREDYPEAYEAFDFKNKIPENKTSEYSKDRIETLKAYIDSIEDKELKELFLRVITRDPSKLAIILGYDVLLPFRGTAGNVVVLNRNKMVFTREEFERIYDEEEKRKRKIRPFKPKNKIFSVKGE